MARFWRTVNLKASLIPDDVILKKDCVNVTEGTKKIENVDLFFREALPPKDTDSELLNVLLLHGRMFSSKTWLDLGTINILSAMGYRTIAVDLPGYANTQAAEISDKANFLRCVLHSFNMKNPVIVSPSMSGFYALPYLVKHWKDIAGYIPVAPVGIEVLESMPVSKDSSAKNLVYVPLQEFLHDPIPDLSFIQTPTMVVFGEKDRSRSSALLNLLPLSQCQEIPNGSHPAYLDNPNLWHQLLYNFLTQLSHTYCLEETNQ